MTRKKELKKDRKRGMWDIYVTLSYQALNSKLKGLRNDTSYNTRALSNYPKYCSKYDQKCLNVE